MRWPKLRTPLGVAHNRPVTMEDWRSSVGRILTNTAVNLEHGFQYNLPAPELSHGRPKGPLPHKARQVEYVPTPDLQTGDSPVPSGGVMDVVLTKIVDRVEYLRESIKQVHHELSTAMDMEQSKREMKEREMYLNLKAEVNERIAQMSADWRKTESGLRRHILELEEKQLLVPVKYHDGAGSVATAGNHAFLNLDLQDKIQEKLFDLEAEINKVKRGTSERTKRQDATINEKVKEEVEHCLERLKGVARDAGMQSAAEQWKVRSANMEGLIEERLRQFQELHDGNSVMVIDLGTKIARLGEQVKTDVSASRETLKQELDRVLEQQFLIRDWRDGIENKIRLTNDNFEKRIAKMQVEMLAAVTASKQQMLEDESKLKQQVKLDITYQSEALMETTRLSVQKALKEFSTTSKSDCTKVQTQISAIKNNVEDIHKQCLEGLGQSRKELEELAPMIPSHAQHISHLTEKYRHVNELLLSTQEDARLTKRETKALRQELVEGATSMERLGKDVEGRLRRELW